MPFKVEFLLLNIFCFNTENIVNKFGNTKIKKSINELGDNIRFIQENMLWTGQKPQSHPLSVLC